MSYSRLAVGIALGQCLVAGCALVLGIENVPPAPLGDGDGGVEAEIEAGDAAVVTDAPDSAACGLLGQRCCPGDTCTDGSQCATGSKGARCVAFAGVFEKATVNACGAAACANANPVTNDCTCPAGWSSATSEIDLGCGDAGAPMHLAGTMGLCGISKLVAGSDWAGAFVVADLPMCEPTYDGGCMMRNPLTNACSCPSIDGGMEQVPFRVFVPGAVNGNCNNGFLGGALVACLPTGATPTSLYGIYEKDAFGACRTHSQRLSGCMCPQNTVESKLQTIEESPDNCGMACQFPETTITFCVGL